MDIENLYANVELEDMVMMGGTWNKPSGHKNKKKQHPSDDDNGCAILDWWIHLVKARIGRQ